jgi:HEPN domain-containing protein
MMSRRYKDWLMQAQRDLKAAHDSLVAGNFEWTAFQAQQGAEKALKALLRYHNHEARGHTLVHLLGSAQDFVVVPSDLWPKVRELDRHYIQPRYPNGFATGYPAEFYDQETAERALTYGTEILEFVQGYLA